MNQDQSQNPQPAEPKIEEAVVVEEPKLADETTKPNLEEKPAPPGEPEIYTVRSEETGDKVYAVRQGKRYWVKNPETLKKMGFYLGKEKKIPFSELLNFPEGEPIDLTIPDAIYPWDRPEGENKVEANNPSRTWL